MPGAARASAVRAEGLVGGGQAILVGLAKLRVKSPFAGIEIFFAGFSWYWWFQ
ncbi:hypothetical protein Paes_2384 (plasmid) [Prosthecochloris aestuarii DSM 271]|uniref:Uncharacterized protein n=1 Tax=Prosthecochloris aestuarii (strain DSM 271 / SK 413) TaxID=290512 RepID=B4S9P7_PROA2|nr:hypothetical protein Paes_2384 [Prosthecochloris aestuarii DSM 271]